MGVLYFCSAVLLIIVAHLIRIFRWELFIQVYEKPDRKNLIQSMSYGYLLNYILPFKLGEIVRAWKSGKKMRNGKALGFSTVIVDRYLDIVCVGIIFAILSLVGNDDDILKNTAKMYSIFAVALLAVAVFVFVFKSVIKKICRAVASVFNERIESVLLVFAWALIWNFKDIFKKIDKIKLFFYTVLMWAGYLISYLLFAMFLNTLGSNGATWTDVFVMLFAQNSVTGSTGIITLYKNTLVVSYPIYMIIYMTLPIILLLGFTVFYRRKEEEVENDNYLRLLPHMEQKERLEFLENYFSDKNRDYVKNYLKINQGISIIRDYSAGSNATTMLCMDGKKTFFRKYAFGDDGEKLYQQICWIEENQDKLALPQILFWEKTDLYCYYDMPFNSNSVGLFEYAHSMPVEQTWKIIQLTLESLENSIYKTDVRPADNETIHKYIESKVKKNLDKIKNGKKIKDLQHYDTIIINGVEYRNLSFYEKYLSEEYLKQVFSNDTYAVIHGDLTIENIICTRDESGKDDFYIIDPNTGNIHDSPNLDYGKLLQSIHGGYEFLMSIKNVTVSGNRINFLFTKSSSYIELHNRLRDYMENNLGKERSRSIYFHEIIHWLRLMPYKIEKDGERSLLFYAGLLMVMKDVIEMYEKD